MNLNNWYLMAAVEARIFEVSYFFIKKNNFTDKGKFCKWHFNPFTKKDFLLDKYIAADSNLND